MSSLSGKEYIKIEEVEEFLERESGMPWDVREGYLAAVTKDFKGKSELPKYDFMEIVKELQYSDHHRCTKGDAQAIYAKIIK